MVSSRLRGVPVAEEVPLAPLTTLRVGPVARRVFTCETTDQIIAVIESSVAVSAPESASRCSQ